jgi:hypothetical protein
MRFAFLLLTILLVGCDDKARPPTQAEVVGNWAGNISTLNIRLTLNADGSLAYDDDGNINPMSSSAGMQKMPMFGSWRISPEGELVVGDDKGVTVHSLDLEFRDTNELRIRHNESTTFTIKRVGNPPPAPATGR